MEYMSSSTAPKRGHKAVQDSSVVAKLDALADKAMVYRSVEQAYTDHRQATGYQLKGPLPFGTFECGRGSMPGNATSTAVFRDLMKRGIVYPHMNGSAKVDIGECVLATKCSHELLAL